MSKFSATELAEACGGFWLDALLPEAPLENILTDSRADLKNALFIPLSGEHFDGHDFIAAAIESGAAAAVAARSKIETGFKPAVPTLVVEDTLDAYQRIARFHRRRMGQNLTVIGVTGSSGKTSTKEILRAVLCVLAGPDALLVTEANTNNHIGVPLNLLKINKNHRFAVIEMGTNHPGEIEVLARTAEPDAGIITVIGASHLEFFQSEANVAREKSDIFKYMNAAGVCVIPLHSSGQEYINHAVEGKKCLTFGDVPEASVRVEVIESRSDGGRFRLNAGKQSAVADWKIPGIHQMHNAAAAAAVCLALGFELEKITGALSQTTLPGMRSKVTRRGQTTWINDAYNANPESMKAALEWLSTFANTPDTLLVLGSMGELGKASEEAHLSVLKRVRLLLPDAKTILIGKAMVQAAKTLAFDALCFETSDEAVQTVQTLGQLAQRVFLKGSRSMRLEKTEPSEEGAAHD